MKALIYCRVSTEDQEREGTSLGSQVKACLKLARERGHEVPEEYIFREVWSGAEMDRPLLNKARDLIRGKEVNAAIFFSTDRLARNPIHIAIIAEECEKRGIDLIFVTEPLDNSPEGQLIRYVKGYAAQIEREKIRERTVRGKREKAKLGLIPGATKCYGYDYVSGEGRRVVNEEEAAVVRKIFHWYVEGGLSLYQLCLKLMDMDVPAPKGGSLWRTDTLSDMLRNERYVGKTYFGKYASAKAKNPRKANTRYPNTARVLKPREEWLEIPGVTPAIVDKRLFDAAQERLLRNLNLSSRNRKRPYLLSGYLFCSNCGRRFAGSCQIDNGKERRFYYCTGTSKVSKEIPCTTKRLNAELVEKQIWDEVKKALTNPETIIAELERRQNESDAQGKWQQHLEDILKRLEANRRQQARLVTLYRYGEIDDEFILRENRKLKNEQKMLEGDKVRLEAQLNASIPSVDQVKLVREYCRRAARNIERFTFEEKRLALEALQVRVIATGNGLELYGILPVGVDYVSTTTAVP